MLSSYMTPEEKAHLPKSPVPHIQVHRYSNPEDIGYYGLIEPDDLGWILYLDKTGRPCHYFEQREANGAVVGGGLVITDNRFKDPGAIATEIEMRKDSSLQPMTPQLVDGSYATGPLPAPFQVGDLVKVEGVAVEVIAVIFGRDVILYEVIMADGETLILEFENLVKFR